MKRFKYQSEYENTEHCFWEPCPGKYIKLFVDKYEKNLTGFAILDLGAGEGKNAVYLANRGAAIEAVDISDIALSRFDLQPDFDKVKSRITKIHQDIRLLNFDLNSFNVVIAYGVFHTLENISEIYQLIDKIWKWLKNRGYLIVVTFTSLLPPPKIQDYLTLDAFVNKEEFLRFLNNWELLEVEEEIIEEMHPPKFIVHKHSLIRLIIRKNDTTKLWKSGK